MEAGDADIVITPHAIAHDIGGDHGFFRTGISVVPAHNTAIVPPRFGSALRTTVTVRAAS